MEGGRALCFFSPLKSPNQLTIKHCGHKLCGVRCAWKQSVHCTSATFTRKGAAASWLLQTCCRGGETWVRSGGKDVEEEGGGSWTGCFDR
eukprot:364542-Chlamydomonas_euryale.AAC.7